VGMNPAISDVRGRCDGNHSRQGLRRSAVKIERAVTLVML
jgi:hypothetical protein